MLAVMVNSVRRRGAAAPAIASECARRSRVAVNIPREGCNRHFLQWRGRSLSLCMCLVGCEPEVASYAVPQVITIGTLPVGTAANTGALTKLYYEGYLLG